VFKRGEAPLPKNSPSPSKERGSGGEDMDKILEDIIREKAQAMKKERS
jgi:hypothetical protein